MKIFILLLSKELLSLDFKYSKTLYSMACMFSQLFKEVMWHLWCQCGSCVPSPYPHLLHARPCIQAAYPHICNITELQVRQSGSAPTTLHPHPSYCCLGCDILCWSAHMQNLKTRQRGPRLSLNLIYFMYVSMKCLVLELNIVILNMNSNIFAQKCNRAAFYKLKECACYI